MRERLDRRIWNSYVRLMRGLRRVIRRKLCLCRVERQQKVLATSQLPLTCSSHTPPKTRILLHVLYTRPYERVAYPFGLMKLSLRWETVCAERSTKGLRDVALAWLSSVRNSWKRSGRSASLMGWWRARQPQARRRSYLSGTIWTQEHCFSTHLPLRIGWPSTVAREFRRWLRKSSVRFLSRWVSNPQRRPTTASTGRFNSVASRCCCPAGDAQRSASTGSRCRDYAASEK